MTDAPIKLGTGDTLEGKHVVVGGSLIGRVLFWESPTMVEIAQDASNVAIINNYFDASLCLNPWTPDQSTLWQWLKWKARGGHYLYPGRAGVIRV